MERKSGNNLRPSDKILMLLLREEFQRGIASGNEELLTILGATVARFAPLDREQLIAGLVKTLSVKQEHPLPSAEVYLSRIHLLGQIKVDDVDEEKLRRLRDGVIEVLRPAPKPVKDELKTLKIPVLSDPRLESVYDLLPSGDPILDPFMPRKEAVKQFWDALLDMFEGDEYSSDRKKIAGRLGIKVESVNQDISVGFIPKEGAVIQLLDSLPEEKAAVIKILYDHIKSIKSERDQ